MLGKTQNNSGKTETFNHPILNLLHKQQGYELCRTVCHQPYHAEESAIIDWLIDCGNFDEHDATISVYGAKAMCERCKALCERYKLQVVKVTPHLMEFI